MSGACLPTDRWPFIPEAGQYRGSLQCAHPRVATSQQSFSTAHRSLISVPLCRTKAIAPSLTGCVYIHFRQPWSRARRDWLRYLSASGVYLSFQASRPEPTVRCKAPIRPSERKTGSASALFREIFGLPYVPTFAPLSRPFARTTTALPRSGRHRTRTCRRPVCPSSGPVLMRGWRPGWVTGCGTEARHGLKTAGLGKPPQKRSSQGRRATSLVQALRSCSIRWR